MRRLYEVVGANGTPQVWDNPEWAERRAEEIRREGVPCEIRPVEWWGEVRERTHYPGCWQGHLECAVAVVRELQEALSHVLSTYRVLVSEGRLHTPGGCEEMAAAVRQAGEVLNGVEG